MSNMKTPKRRIIMNVWGNWNGYEGTRKTQSFGMDERAAREWKETGKTPTKPQGPIVFKKFDPS